MQFTGEEFLTARPRAAGAGGLATAVSASSSSLSSASLCIELGPASPGGLAAAMRLAAPGADDGGESRPPAIAAAAAHGGAGVEPAADAGGWGGAAGGGWGCGSPAAAPQDVHYAPADGWFRKCRGCGWQTAHERAIGQVDVPFCKRCDATFLTSCPSMRYRMVEILLYVHEAWTDAGL
ncbi:MAG: hypothetical protein J3K34DRAFT_527618 [Monoraphidium minutum]|nr:MAG: hypothetical protein J3K34DRAFT_527618 [Monoraphidium minutum]